MNDDIERLARGCNFIPPPPSPPRHACLYRGVLSMKMKHILLLLAVVVGGCGERPMTNEEIIAAKKQCAEAGMGIRGLIDPWTFKTVRVECR